MYITKKETKLMAFVTAFVMMLSCLVVMPAEVKAAGKAPVVSILGASLRMDADDGHQSMRIGVQVENASQAKACGVELTIGNKTVKIATDGDGEAVLKGDKIYEYNEAKDTILYTAVITNIPNTAFSTAISAKGSATPVEEGDAVVSDAVEKSVNDVVESLKKKIANLKLSEDGNLSIGTEIASLNTSTVDSLKERETFNDFWNWTARPNPPAGTAEDSTLRKGDAAVEYDNNAGALKFTTDSTTGKGLSYQTVRNDLNNVEYQFEVKAEKDTQFMIVKFFDLDATPKYTATGDWQTITVSTAMEQYSALSLSTVEKGATYYVKSCKILQYRPLTSDDVTMHLPKETVTLSIANAVGGGTGKLADGSPAPAGSVETKNDGSILIKNHIFVCIPLDKTYPAGSKLKVTVYGECAQTGLRGWCAGGNSDGGATSNQQAPMNFGTAYTYTTTGDSTYFEIKVPSHDSPVFTTLHITKVELTDLT